MNGSKRILLVLACAVFSLMLTGCTNWEKKYKGLSVENENLKGLYANAMDALDSANSERGMLSSQIQQKDMAIDELQKQIEESKSAAKGSGFDGYDVAFDAEKGTLTVTLPNAILFAPGKASLKSVRNADLDQIYSVLKSKYSGKRIDIVGHTDSDPIKKSKWSDNWQLSSERSLSVLRYLVSKGISDDNIRAVGQGSSLPIDSNSTSAGKARNRRVEIVVNMR